MRFIFLQLIRAYRLFISPFTVPSCRYYPTCSHYAMEAIETHGAIRGAWLAGKRLLRCHPLAKGGYDPVPEAGDTTHHCNCTKKGYHRG